MSTEAELLAQIKLIGDELRALKSARKPRPEAVEGEELPSFPAAEPAEEAAVSEKLKELKELKAKFEEVTGHAFEGGSVPVSAKKAARPASEAEVSKEIVPAPPAFEEANSEEAASAAVPPAPPSPRTEACASESNASTYNARIVATACALAGKDKHKSTMFNGNMIARFLVPNLAGAEGNPESAAILGWMGTAKNVDDPDHTHGFVASVLPVVTSTLEEEGSAGFLVGGSVTLADVSVYLALAVAPGFESESLPESARAWCAAVSGFVTQTSAEAKASAKAKEEAKKAAKEARMKPKENSDPAAQKAAGSKEDMRATNILAAALSPRRSADAPPLTEAHVN